MKSRNFILTLGLIFSTFHLFGQIIEFDAKKSNITKSENLKNMFSEYETFEFNGNAFNESFKEEYLRNNRNGVVDIDLQIGDEKYQLELEEINLISKDYFISVFDGEKTKIIKEKPTVKTYKGYHKSTGKQVRLTIDKGFIYGFIETGKTTMYIEPVFYYEPEVRKDVFFIYDIDDAAPVPERTCAADFTKESVPHFHKDVDGDRNLGCKEIEYGIANDYSMFTKYGGQIGLQNRNIGVVNSFQPNWLGAFDYDYEFVIVTQYISNCSTCDPWTSSTDPGNLLDDFSDWGSGGNFGVTIDVATLWSDRNFDGSTVGLAWLNAVCNNNIKYNICEDFTTNAEFTRVLVAHELGHNFGTGHDAPGANFIMAPSVNNATQFSSSSINQINGYMNGFWVTCDTDCPPDQEPEADFGSDIQEGCAELFVNFFDESEGNPTSWSWSFPGGIPATSTQQNPTVIYPNPGFYEVTLVATNSVGSSTETKSNFITVNGFDPLDIQVVQNGPTVSFINNSDPSYLYFWDLGDGTTSNDYSPEHTYTQSGPVTITVEAIGECGMETLTFNIIVILPIFADFFGDVTEGCTPLEVQFLNLSSEEATDFEWEFEGGTPATSTEYNPIVLYETPGVYTVTLTAINIYTSDEKVEVGYITVNPDPIADFDIIQDEAFISTINNSEFGDTYLWDFGDGATSLDFQPTHTYTESGTYVVELQVTNSCGTVSETFTVNVNLGVEADFSYDVAEGCAPLTVQFNDESFGEIDSYSWSFPGGTPNTSTQANPIVTYTTPGTYSVTLEVSNSNDSDQITLTDLIEVNGLPIFDVDFVQNNETVTLTNNSSNFTSIFYNMGDGTDFEDVDEVIHTYSSPGNYEIVVTLENECGTVEETFNVNIAEDVNAFFNYTVDGECAPVTVQYTNLSSGDNLTYAWTFPNGNPSTSTLENPVVTYNQPGIVSATLTVSDGNENSMFTINNVVNVLSLPIIDIDFSKDGNTVTLVNNSLYDDEITYDFGDGTIINNQAIAVHTYDEEGNYTITVTVSNECGEVVQVFNNVDIQFPSVAGFSAGITDGCVTFTAQFQNMSSDNSTGFIWSFEGGSPSSSTLENPSVDYNNPGVFDVQLISIAPGGNDTLLLEDYIIVGILPDAFFTFNRSGLTVDFTDQSDFGNTYLWDFGDGNNSTAQNPSHTYAEEDIYTVTLIVTNECGSDTVVRTVNLFNIPQSGFEVSEQTGCTPFQVQYENLTEGEVDTYLWLFEGGSPQTSNEENPLVTYNESGNYDVTLISTNAMGSDTLTFPNYISVLTQPDIQITTDLSGFTATLTATQFGGYTYNWTIEGGIEKTGATVVHTFNGPGVYQVELLVTGPCGTYEELVEITISSNAPITNFSTMGGGTSGCAPFEIQFSDQSINDPTEWFWEFPGGEPAKSNEQNPVVTYNNPGVYSVTLTASNNVGEQTRLKVNYVSAFGDPNALFEADIEANTVSFENLSSGGGSYTWDFGDGNTSEESSPTHSYSVLGEYNATLIVSNSCGADTFNMTINILTVSNFEISTNVDISVYPNPTRGTITIDYKNLTSSIVSYELISLLGSTIVSVKIDPSDRYNSGAITKNFNYNGLGTAILKVNFEDGQVYFEKLIFID